MTRPRRALIVVVAVIAVGWAKPALPDSANDIQRSRYTRYIFCMERALGQQWWERYNVRLSMNQWGVSHPEPDAIARTPAQVQKADARCRADNQIDERASAGGSNGDAPWLRQMDRVQAKIKTNLACFEPMVGNPWTHIEIDHDAAGVVQAVRTASTSGNAAWDQCVIEAAYRASPLPNGETPPELRHLKTFRTYLLIRYDR